MTHLPKMEVKFWKTLTRADGERVSMFYFDDPAGVTQMSFAVPIGRGDQAQEVGRRVNSYPELLSLIDRMALALDPTSLTSDKNRAVLIQEARDILGIT